MTFSRIPRPVTVVAIELLAVGVPLGTVLLSHPTKYAFAFPTAVIACLALPLRLRWPRLALLICVPALAGGLGLPPAIVALYRVGRASRRVRDAVAWVVGTSLVVVLPLHLTADLAIADRIMSLLFTLVGVGGPAAMGVLVRLRGELAESLAEVRRARKAELEARSDRARADERARIAREIHDAVGHNATLIAVQSAALAATTKDPQAKETAERLRELAKQSLAEMRTALGLVTVDQHTLHGLADIPDLLNRARSAGVTVSATGDHDEIQTSPAVSRAIYRVVQEALTNALKHAPGAPIKVTLTQTPTRVRVMVVNAAPPTHPPNTDGSGTGLEGLTERVHTAGGTFQATPLPDGGYQVIAELPPKVDPSHPTSGGSTPLPTRS
ncbi:sensor histidine kinase [Actinokineospora iranica]|uniref:histidine kinase n=1 Tax=Actinokineospora iranica TaxID=1271860 RepID=A0A1G6WPZ2_9PSEU|nr:sensor histidine kinase [Actinokineospora iranica]SDD67952.1 Signal transduction histidine kinase [Actinokineospora iranica]